MCRMLIAIGEVDVSTIIDDFKLIAGNQNERHENNEDQDFKHWDGWGFSFLENNKIQVIKSTAPFYEDEKVELLKELKSPFYVLHARRKSPGKGLVRLENVHPFVHSNYIFCHNGTVNDELHFDEKYVPLGETDSERFFYHILSALNGKLNEKIIFEKYKHITDFTGLNSIISDGCTSFIINSYTKKPKYYTFKLLKRENFIVISSEVLPHYKDQNWIRLQNHDVIKLDTKNVAYTRLSL